MLRRPRCLSARSSAPLLAAVLLTLAGCADGDAEQPETTAETSRHESSPHWDYRDPESWADLDPAYAACGEGRAQSPVDLTGSEPAELRDPVLDYPDTPVDVVDNGHTYQATPPEGAATMRLAGRTWRLLQWHVHAPSEHLVDGRPAAAEVHLVHQAVQGDGDLAVLGILVEEGAASTAMAGVLDALPPEEGTPGSTRISLRELLPRSLGTVRYDGSLTTPPCSEGVHWLVATEPVTWSAEQVQAVRERFGGNARPVQPRNARDLDRDEAG